MSSQSSSGETNKKLNTSQELLNFKGKPPIESLLIKKSVPCKVGPSSVLARVKNFLPQLEEANRVLDRTVAEGNAADVDIEDVEDCTGPVIEMNLELFQHELSSDEDEDSADVSDDDDDDSDGEAEKSLDCGGIAETTTESLKVKLPGRGTKRKSEKALIEDLTGDSQECSKPNS